MSEPIPWTLEQIMALAPDEQVGKAARALARPGHWRYPARHGQALWGEHQGSGAEPYRVAVDLEGPAFKCTCPSRKRPCKHALGLLLLAQAEPQALREGPVPPWVVEWLAGRAATPARQAPPPREPASGAQPQAARAARRLERVRQGATALTRWLEDLVRQGLGTLPAQPPGFWETQVARLVDAQATGLARRVRELALVPGSGEGWPARALDRLGRLYLLLEAFGRLEGLPPDLQEEVRTQIGWAQSQEALAARPGVRDRWAVVGRRVTEEDRLRVQRTWLWGLQGQRGALLLDFAPPGRPFASSLAPGTGLDAELVFWPGPQPLRALVKGQPAAIPLAALPALPSLAAALEAYGHALAGNPWLERWLLPVEGVVPWRRGEGWAVRDRSDHTLPLALPSKGSTSSPRPTTATGG